MGFYDCLYSIEGKKANDEIHSVKKKRASNTGLTTFDSSDGHNTDWYYLQVTTEW